MTIQYTLTSVAGNHNCTRKVSGISWPWNLCIINIALSKFELCSSHAFHALAIYWSVPFPTVKWLKRQSSRVLSCHVCTAFIRVTCARRLYVAMLMDLLLFDTLYTQYDYLPTYLQRIHCPWWTLNITAQI